LHWGNAAVLFDEVVASWRALGKRFELGQALALRSGVAFGQGDLDLAVSLAEEAATLLREIGHQSWEALTEWYLGMFAAERSQLPEAIRRFRTSAHTFIEAGDSVWLYKPLVGLAAVAVALHQVECAARLLGAVDAQLQQTGAQLLPFDSPAHARAERGARDALSDADFDLAYQSGSTLSVAELVSEIDRVGEAEQAIETAQVVGTGKASHGLTARELDVLRLIAEGRTDREIAEALFLSYRTVTSYVTSILGKLSVDSRTAAATQAIRRGLV
jgi:DNA-binding CsgD family transcriptional regulator